MKFILPVLVFAVLFNLPSYFELSAIDSAVPLGEGDLCPEKDLHNTTDPRGREARSMDDPVDSVGKILRFRHF